MALHTTWCWWPTAAAPSRISSNRTAPDRTGLETPTPASRPSCTRGAKLFLHPPDPKTSEPRRISRARVLQHVALREGRSPTRPGGAEGGRQGGEGHESGYGDQTTFMTKRARFTGLLANKVHCALTCSSILYNRVRFLFLSWFLSERRYACGEADYGRGSVDLFMRRGAHRRNGPR
ncbi:hypothetical protein B0J13DRAFT_259416 [Dactylonectria estremocensis]|uniref:Uncharacterized protein n=1 Tax=Dactylonectria estremocensis TaxID=1079267 RepID=A0A9P9F354_9HYPO|nr:hypothetical protein B0J13DRAFT_259416 [Dactylonectria estremocensis]